VFCFHISFFCASFLCMSRGMKSLSIRCGFSSAPLEIGPPFLCQSCFIFRNCCGVCFCFWALW